MGTRCCSRPRPTGSPASPTPTGKETSPKELARLRRHGLIIVDEVGYLHCEQDAANLFVQLVASRYEHASLTLTSNLLFSGWGGVFGDQAVAAAMIDRIGHHADVPTLKDASKRHRSRGTDNFPSMGTQDRADQQHNQPAARISPPHTGLIPEPFRV